MIKVALKAFKIFIKSIIIFISLLIAYFLAAIILSAIPVKGKPAPKEDVPIYLLSNGVHTDLVLPIKNQYKDWSTHVKYTNINSADTTFEYLAIGWGDKAFYLETPNWSDLKFKTAFNAAFGLGPSAIHATFFKRMVESETCIRLSLSDVQYLKLVSYIESSFEIDDSGNTLNISFTGNYGASDAFYEARGRYNIFKTCNTWTNKGLKVAGQKASVWTPFDKGIFWHYR
jgi:uncharacterized protein (TIGR02117 family)